MFGFIREIKAVNDALYYTCPVPLERYGRAGLRNG